MMLGLIVSNFPPMDRWKNEIMHDGWWLVKMKTVIDNDRSSQAAKQTRKKNSEAQTKHTNK